MQLRILEKEKKRIIFKYFLRIFFSRKKDNNSSQILEEVYYAL